MERISGNDAFFISYNGCFSKIIFTINSSNSTPFGEVGGDCLVIIIHVRIIRSKTDHQCMTDDPRKFLIWKFQDPIYQIKDQFNSHTRGHQNE